jgi:uncharacterized damage-inducible protein DinB
MTFKDLLGRWAAYTSAANDEMLKVLSTLPGARILEPSGTYYKNIAGLLDHGYRSTVFWIKRASDGGAMPEWLPGRLAEFSLPPPEKILASDLAAFSAMRKRLDAFIVEVCGRGDEASYASAFTFVGRDKTERRMEFGAALLTAMNHEVHHRGGVATILDGWGVANDWSSFMPFMLAR